MTKKTFFILIGLLTCFITADSQILFGTNNIITSNADGAESVYIIDIDGDSDLDVLSASKQDDKIVWYENDGKGNFGKQVVLTNNANFAASVYAADLDNDGDQDVLSASFHDDRLAWYENDGNGIFKEQHVITVSIHFPSEGTANGTANGVVCVFASDIDGDGDQDVLAASQIDNKILWYENTENGTFETQHLISTETVCPTSVYATDIDGDGDQDVFSASFKDNKIIWYENDKNGKFLSQHIITTKANGAISVFVSDIDGDGDLDILSASHLDNKIAWYENYGDKHFGEQQIITTNIKGAMSVYTTDLDNDGDQDILSTSYYDNKLAWYENNGSGQFKEQQVISTNARSVRSVFASDLDGDGDKDIVSAYFDDDKIVWYENLSFKISKQPQNKTICSNSNTCFFVFCTNTEMAQWQVNEGDGFRDIFNDLTYYGAKNDTLQISNADIKMSANQYRCILYNVEDSLISDTATLIVEVEIVDNSKPTINCVDNQTLKLQANETVYTVLRTEFDPTSTDDNCNRASFTNNLNSLSTLDGVELLIGETTIVWTITDNVEQNNTCSFNVQVSVAVGIEALEKKRISIYPNPTNGKINFEFTKNNVQQIEIYDITGKIIIKQTEIQPKQTVDISAFSNGTYIINIQTDEEVFTTKIVKE